MTFDIPQIIDELRCSNEICRMCSYMLENLILVEKTDEDFIAYVNLKNHAAIYYNSDKITSKEMFKMVMVHECLHLIFNHIEIDHTLYDMHLLNIALDASINCYCFDLLKSNKSFFPINKKPSVIKHQMFVSGFDTIDKKRTWEFLYEWVFKNKDDFHASGGNGNGEEGVLDKHNKSDGSNESEKGNGMESDNEAGLFNGTDDIIEKVKDLVKDAAKKAGVQPGSTIGNLIIEVSNKPSRLQIWKRKLCSVILSSIRIKEFESTYFKKNRRFSSRDFILPGNKIIFYPRIGIISDTSGSMLSNIKDISCHIGAIFSENGALDYLCFCDTQIQYEKRNVKIDEISKIQLKGFGGTQLTPALEKALLENLDILILITDLEVDMRDINKINDISKKKSPVFIVCCVDKWYKNKEDANKKIFPKTNILYV